MPTIQWRFRTATTVARCARRCANPANCPRTPVKDRVVEGFMPQAASDKMREFIRSHRDRPFFLNYWMSPPHMPIGPGNLPDKYRGTYGRDDVVLRDNVYGPDGQLSHDEWWFKVYTKWDYFWRTRDGSPDAPGDALPPGFDLRDLTAYYCEAVTCADDLGGRNILAALDEQGIADNTIVILSADHGELLGNHGTYNKDRLYEEAIRVPIIYRYPLGFGPGESDRQVASNVDVAPTILDSMRTQRAAAHAGAELAASHPATEASGRQGLRVCRGGGVSRHLVRHALFDDGNPHADPQVRH